MSGSFIGTCASGVYNGTSTKTQTVPVTAPVAVGDTIILGFDVPGASANTSATVSDSKGNTWSFKQVGVNGGGSNGQGFLAVCLSVTTALTTSDTITFTVNNAGSVVASWRALVFRGITGYDKGAANVGATSAAFNSGTTAAAVQDSQLLVAIAVYTGTGVAWSSVSPAGFTIEAELQTTGTVRDMRMIWGFVNTPGTRVITASMDSSHAWAGAIVALNTDPAVTDSGIYRLDGTHAVPVLTPVAMTAL
jgi:hypothetical protein